MRKKLIILAALAAIMLNGCQSAQDTSAVSKAAETAQPPETASLSKMVDLGYDATVEEFITAFQEDYVRAAETAGITADHNDLEYGPVVKEGMVMIPLDGELKLIMHISSDMKVVWYAGNPESDEAFLQEMQIVLMAGDNTLSPEQAKTYAEEIWNDGWENRNSNPSAVQKTLPSGVLCTFSINDNHLISFQIAYYKANN